MGKRSSKPRAPRDFYRTFDPAAVRPLAQHIMQVDRYVEPCCGDGALIDNISLCFDEIGVLPPRCGWMGDIEPKMPGAHKFNILEDEIPQEYRLLPIITNPPFSIAIQIIERLLDKHSGIIWLLLPADWMHNIGMAHVLRSCLRIVSVGRVCWIEGSGARGKDNFAWYLFLPGYNGRPTFCPRQAPRRGEVRGSRMPYSAPRRRA